MTVGNVLRVTLSFDGDGTEKAPLLRMLVETRIKGQWEPVEDGMEITGLSAKMPKDAVRKACHLLADAINEVYQRNLLIEDPAVELVEESGGYATVRLQSGKLANMPDDLAREFYKKRTHKPIGSVVRHLSAIKKSWVKNGIPKKIRDALGS